MRQTDCRAVSLLTAAMLLFVLSASPPARAAMRFPEPYNDQCTWLGGKLGDAYIERDFNRCEFAKETIRKQGREADERSFAEYCEWLADKTGNRTVATDDQACAKESTRVGTAATMDRNHPNRAALREFQASLPLSNQKTMCVWLADEKYGKKILTGKDDISRGSCWEFQRKQYAESPQTSLAEYSSYCAYIARSLPGLSATDTKRFCPDIEKEIRSRKDAVAMTEKMQQDHRTAVSRSAMMWALLMIGAAAAAYYFLVILPKQRAAARAKALVELYEARMARVLAGAGRTREERAAVLTRSFDKRDATLSYEEDGSGLTLDADVFESMSFEIRRTITTMDPAELTALRTLYLLANEDLIDPRWFDWQRFALIYGDGRASIGQSNCKMAKTYNEPMRDFPAALSLYARRRSVSASAAVTNVLACLHRLEQQQPDNQVIKKLRRLVVGGGEWLSEDEMSQSIFNTDADRKFNLLLGVMDSSQGLHYQGEGSLVTIAPSRSGKSQCHVIPNLLTWAGAALVLDVKGELYPATHVWRDRKIGPIYRFAPFDPENSHCFNPLSFVRGDRFNVWEDALYLADMFMVNTGDHDKFWQQRARDILAAIIALTCYGVPPEERSMDRVLRTASRVDWTDFVADLIETKDVSSMSEEGHLLEKIEPKMLDSILQTLKISLQPWSTERMRHITRRSDWNPLDMRGGKKPTIYICLQQDADISAWAGVLRVFTGMHLRALQAELPKHGVDPILFMLDELPQLGHMKPVRDALDTGAQYGIRLWMFAQNLSQLRKAYEGLADGMIGGCAVQAYMNPSGHDGTAEHISKLLGERRGALDGQRQKVVEASELTGPDYKDVVIVFGRHSAPAKVFKVFAWSNPEFRRRMELEPRAK